MVWSWAQSCNLLNNHSSKVMLRLRTGRWRQHRWERNPLPRNAREIPSCSEEQSEQPTVFQHIRRSETKDRGHWKIRRWDKKTWSTEKTRVRPCYTHKHQLKTSEHRRLRRQHHRIPLAFYHRSSYHKPRDSEQSNLRSRGQQEEPHKQWEAKETIPKWKERRKSQKEY